MSLSRASNVAAAARGLACLSSESDSEARGEQTESRWRTQSQAGILICDPGRPPPATASARRQDPTASTRVEFNKGMLNVCRRGLVTWPY